jgi:FtsP/CotA-like multicopper oxidase with cupredoxin domain
LFTALLVPAVGLHQAIHSVLRAEPGISPVLAHLIHARTPAHGGALAHGLRDALPAFPVALAIAAVTLGRRRRIFSPRVAAAVMSMAFVVVPMPALGGPVITAFATALPIPPTLSADKITLVAQESNLQILPGATTKTWTFGTTSTNGTFPGPTIRRPSGQPTTVTVVNDLPTTAGDITVHHHGNHSASPDDGQPHDYLIPKGGSRTYTYGFTEDGSAERGAFQWYHDHRMDVTGRNVWMGLAGMVILDDPAEAAINAELPAGDRDVPLMITDRTFDNSNQIPYTFTAEGVNGNAILVNGAPQPYFEVADVKYRLRILNASNTRSYDFKLSDGRAMTQIATESGLLPAPVTRTHILLGPAERVEVVVDFSGEMSQDVTLLNSNATGPNTSSIMQFRVRRDEGDSGTVPTTLRAAPVVETEPLTTTRTWVFGRDLVEVPGRWTINGKGFDPSRVDAYPKLATAERWVFVNSSDVDHIVHIHDVDWHIVSRSPIGANIDGLLGEAGLRESFRLRPNEIVVVVSRFTDHVGKFVLHCHMLEHEDFSMMAQFEVVA